MENGGAPLRSPRGRLRLQAVPESGRWLPLGGQGHGVGVAGGSPPRPSRTEGALRGSVSRSVRWEPGSEGGVSPVFLCPEIRRGCRCAGSGLAGPQQARRRGGRCAPTFPGPVRAAGLRRRPQGQPLCWVSASESAGMFWKACVCSVFFSDTPHFQTCRFRKQQPLGSGLRAPGSMQRVSSENSS